MSRELVLWALLTACAYRATRLLIRDTFPPVLWIRDRLAGGWRPLTEPEQARSSVNLQSVADTFDDPTYGQLRMIDFKTSRYVRRASWSSYWLAELITCPWCASAYVSGALVGITDCVVGIQWPWLMGGAVWAGGSLLASRTWA